MINLKKIFRVIIIYLLQFEARLILQRYQPRLIGITGNTGKTSAKDAIYAVLAKSFNVRASAKSFNSEIGVPLSILGRPNAWGRPFGWLKNLIAGLILSIIRHNYPAWLVLEIGVDRPADLQRLTRWLKLEAAVLTNLPAVPVHLEAFSSAEELIREKLILLMMVKNNGVIVLNGDDERIAAAREELQTNFNQRQLRVLTYGFKDGNDLRLSNEHLYYENGQPAGLTFKIDYQGHTVPFRLVGLIGRHQLYAPAAALAVGAALNLNLVEMAEALTAYQPPPGRLRLLRGLKDSMILDDTYNASPAAMTEALNTLKEITASGRKIAVLGDMLELGEKTIEAHRQIGLEAALAADLIITVGIRAKFIAEAASQKGIHPDNLKHFAAAQAAGRELEQLLRPGDLVLVKGSQSIRLEWVVEEIMAEPERKEEWLCRQESEWQAR
ncbi:MAG: UDP-N-acetylmuramoyl-tripeptide--D-alanyl-D-alanine ligase [Patescibacteria group bacterium]